MHARWWRVKLCAVGMRNAILGNDLKDAFSWSKSDFIVNTERKNARELASFKLSVLSSAKTIELYRFSRRLSCNPSPALIIFSGFSPLNRFGGESYLVMSRNLKREIWSHYEIPAFHKIKPCLQMIMFDKHNYYIPRLSVNKMSTVIGWFLVTCLWSNSNVSRPGNNCTVVAHTLSLFVSFCYLIV